jgi:hypothetical protein
VLGEPQNISAVIACSCETHCEKHMHNQRPKPRPLRE